MKVSSKFYENFDKILMETFDEILETFAKESFE